MTTSKTIFTRLFIGTLALAAGSTTPLIAQLPYTGGHGDIGVELHGGTELEFHFHFHTGAVIDGTPLTADDEFEAGDIFIVVPSSTLTSAPMALPAAGVNMGDDIWLLPQGNPGNNTVPFLGIAAEELDPADWSSPITFSLLGATSPSGSGTFSVFQLGFPNAFYFSSTNAAATTSDNTLLMPIGDHDHYFWGFTEPGTWTVELGASGTHQTLGLLTTSDTFTFRVIPEPAAAPVIVALLAGLGLWRRR